MRPVELSTLQAATGGTLIEAGTPLTAAATSGSGADLRVGPDVVIDSRAVTAGALFVAIPGERVDGHDFLAAARAAGAAAALVQRRVEDPLPQLLVADTVQGLSRLARHVVAEEQQRGLIVCAVTGSSGKTSMKDLLAQVLEADGPTVSPVGSFNNEIGVPLTAVQLAPQSRYLVSEMGARGIGHLAWLCSLVPPDIAIVLNVGTAHLGEFGSAENIARAKGEIVEAVRPGGWAVLNASDALVAAMALRTTERIAWFGPGAPEVCELAVNAEQITATDLDQYGFDLVVRREGVSSHHRVQLALIGRHQVDNALAAAAAAIAAGMDPGVVADALSGATPRSPWRMELIELRSGAAVINDAYNANPDSMAAALRTLAAVGRRRKQINPQARTVAILGDMFELGNEAAVLHEQVGGLVAAEGIDELLAIGAHAPDMVRGAASLGDRARQVGVEEAVAAADLAGGDVALVKASRGMALEKLAQRWGEEA